MALLRKLAGGKYEDDDEVNSIIENINNILSTRRGYGFFLQDFGMSDYHHLNSGNDIAEIIIKDLKENIENFEPRVEVVGIVNIKDDKVSRMSFSVDCLIRDNRQPLKLFLDPVRGCSEVKS